jgi:hypothetical protein
MKELTRNMWDLLSEIEERCSHAEWVDPYPRHRIARSLERRGLIVFRHPTQWPVCKITDLGRKVLEDKK